MKINAWRPKEKRSLRERVASGETLKRGPVPGTRSGPPSKYDLHMDDRTEQAIDQYLIDCGDARVLRDFAASIADKVPPHLFPDLYFPVGAQALRQRADEVEASQAMMIWKRGHWFTPLPKNVKPEVPAQLPPPPRVRHAAGGVWRQVTERVSGVPESVVLMKWCPWCPKSNPAGR